MISIKHFLSLLLSASLTVTALVSCGDGAGKESADTSSAFAEIEEQCIPALGAGKYFPPRTETDAETEESPAVEPMPQVICIDPGHGFDDGGTSSEYLGGLNEDDITLAISLMVKEELQKLGYQTVLTHDGKEFPVTSAYDNNNKYRPAERTAFANSVDIDYYVSIHCNSHTNPDAEGTRIYFFDGYIKEEHTSDLLAEAINDGVLQYLPLGSTSTVIKMTENVFHVLRETKVPASLVEVGFVTNASDAAKMLDADWQRSFAKGVAAGIDSYYRSN